jgi:hypothetical protein
MLPAERSRGPASTWVGALGALALLPGCEAPTQPAAAGPRAPAPVVAPARAPEGLGDRVFGEFVSRRFGARVPLPDGQGWRIDDHRDNWLSATHGRTGSALLVRAWREDSIANRQRCEDKARLWRKLPERAGAEIVERKAVNVPPDFDTVVDVGIVPSKGQAPGAPARIDAFAMAFGGRAHRCFAYVFTTSAEGAGAEQVVGERLGTMVQGSLEKLVFESDLTPRIERAPGLEVDKEGR